MQLLVSRFGRMLLRTTPTAWNDRRVAALFAVILVACVSLTFLPGMANERNGPAPGRPMGVERERSIQDSESGSYFVRMDGVLLLRSRRYDIRDFQRDSDLVGTRTVGNLLLTTGWYELHPNMKLVLLPYRAEGSQRLASDYRILDQQPRTVWNILGSSGWYEIRGDMQLLLYPARNRSAGEPPSLGLDALSKVVPDRENRIGSSQNGFYFIARNGSLLLMQAASSQDR